MEKKEYIPEAYISVCNNLAITIMIVDEDHFRYKMGENKPSRTCKIYTSKRGFDYVIIRGTRYLLRDFMRVI